MIQRYKQITLWELFRICHKIANSTYRLFQTRRNVRQFTNFRIFSNTFLVSLSTLQSITIIYLYHYNFLVLVRRLQEHLKYFKVDFRVAVNKSSK